MQQYFYNLDKILKRQKRCRGRNEWRMEKKNTNRAETTGGYINISCLFVSAAFMKINCICILCVQRYNNAPAFLADAERDIRYILEKNMTI